MLGIGSQVKHPTFGEGVVVAVDREFYKIYFHKEDKAKMIAVIYEGLEVVEGVESEAPPLEMEDFERAMKRVLSDYVEPKPMMGMAGKWIRGTMTLNPLDPDMSNKEIPIETFFHKIVMVRERLRVLEQNINNHEKLDDEDRVHLQQYITRAYGSLTTFNVLFASKENHFKGAGK